MMGSPSTLLLAVTACSVGLSVGLPAVLDSALKVFASTDLELKSFYKALGDHDFEKAGMLFDKLKENEPKLRRGGENLALVNTKMGLHTERFVRLAEVQIKVLLEKMGALINKEDEGERRQPRQRSPSAVVFKNEDETPNRKSVEDKKKVSIVKRQKKQAEQEVESLTRNPDDKDYLMV